MVELIKSAGYTRVVIRPQGKPDEISIAEAKQIVESSSVSLRGWDYPHISIRDDDTGGTEYFAEFVQNWCDWHHHREFWRMYKSGQFLHYKSIREDITNDENVPKHGPVIGIGGLIFTVTEVVEFAHRLFRHGLHERGSQIEFTLGQSRGRKLWVDDPNRMPFTSPRATSSNSITVERSLDASHLLAGDPKESARSMLVEIFDAFGWRPSADQLQSKQDQLYSLGYGRG
ncbi:hypothetical protein PX860_22900 [Agrobacterium leguminum]|uniref:hypothetical protein n=1 Tax=Agrobacterium leguminum TaxID=2792015 RepID=UPI00272B68A7|nr:hypothetical protein [Agrobacterium leguminum]WLD99926.1 hypothetical protein PX860_22900 [Agrobacterium leguminum]